MLAIAIWGATPAATKYAVAEIEAFAVGMLRTALAGLAVAPVILLLRLAWTATGWLALFSSLLAYVAWYWALAGGGVARISTLQFLQPAVTLILAIILFAEAMTPALLLSGAAILIGVAMARRG